MQYFHPKYMYGDADMVRKIELEMNRTKNISSYTYLDQIQKSSNKMSVIIHTLSSFQPYYRFCIAQYLDHDPLKCAITHALAFADKHHDSFKFELGDDHKFIFRILDKLGALDHIYYEYSEMFNLNV